MRTLYHVITLKVIKLKCDCFSAKPYVFKINNTYITCANIKYRLEKNSC